MDADVIVVGAGCIGASTALHLARAGHRVVVLEKEAFGSAHQSGRNSGVIHAGYNLKPGSAKALFCVEGSRRMRAYCRDNGIPMVQGGILVVAASEDDVQQLHTLDSHARANGVQARLVDAAGIGDIEPAASGVAGLHAPEGASVDAGAYVSALIADAARAGATFRFGTRVQDLSDAARILTSDGPVSARVVVNAGGLHADRLAGRLAPDLRVVPFRGTYARLRPAARPLVRSHIYAAPDPRVPFLGVHLSRRASGDVTVGPGAMLAFGQEAYRPWQVQPRDLAATLGWHGFWRLAATPAFRRLVGSEVRKSLLVGAIWQEARRLVPDLRRRDVERGTAMQTGNRAQLVDRDGRLVDDIVVRETGDSVHVLNAVSPGLTCSLPFGQHLAERAAAKL